MANFYLFISLSLLGGLAASKNKSVEEVLLICGGDQLSDCEAGDACSVPALPISLENPNIVLTADGLILTCGGYDLNNHTYNKNCYSLNIEAGTWYHHSTSNYGMAEAISMADGVYRVPIHTEGVEYLATGSTEWQLVPANLAPLVSDSCSVPISDFQFVVIGGIRGMLQVIEFDTRISTWSNWPDLSSLCSHDRLEHSCARLGDTIVISGGSGNKYSGSCDNDGKTTTILDIPWKEVIFEGKDMNAERSNFGKAVVNGKILAFAGHQPSTILDSIEEKEDVLLGEWILLPQKLVTPRYSFGWVSAPKALVCGNK